MSNFKGGFAGATHEGLNRRGFLLGAAAGMGALALGGCASDDVMSFAEASQVYGPLPNERFPVPAVDLKKLNPKFYRKTVKMESAEAPGTIIVDPSNYYVYRIEGEGMATRYGANVGRAGFLWNGDAYIGRKAEWPIWTPPKEMIARQPEAAKYANGMARGSTTRSARARSISTRTTNTRSTRSTAPACRNRSEPASPAAASAC